MVYRYVALAAAAALAAAVALVACASPTPSSPVPPQAAVTPAPTPAPSPTPSTPRVACGVGPGTGDGLEEHCPRTSPSFLVDVNAAIDRAVQNHPELVDLDDHAGPGGYMVRDVDGFFDQVVQEIAAGPRLCAVVDADLEIAVKRDNTLSEQYKLMWSSGYIRRGETSYRATCTPAWF
jgi:hypothetical protein